MTILCDSCQSWNCTLGTVAHTSRMLNVVATLNGISFTVDKGKTKTTPRSQQHGQTNSHPDLVSPVTKPRGVEYYKTLCEKKSQTILQLKNSFKTNNRRFEAMTVVVQSLCAEVSSMTLFSYSVVF